VQGRKKVGFPGASSSINRYWKGVVGTDGLQLHKGIVEYTGFTDEETTEARRTAIDQLHLRDLGSPKFKDQSFFTDDDLAKDLNAATQCWLIAGAPVGKALQLRECPLPTAVAAPAASPVSGRAAPAPALAVATALLSPDGRGAAEAASAVLPPDGGGAAVATAAGADVQAARYVATRMGKAKWSVVDWWWRSLCFRSQLRSSRPRLAPSSRWSRRKLELRAGPKTGQTNGG